MFNEFLILGAIYNLICFTGFVHNTDAQFNFYGNSFAGIIQLCIIVNLIRVVLKAMEAVNRQRKLKKLRQLAKQKYEDKIDAYLYEKKVITYPGFDRNKLILRMKKEEAEAVLKE